MIANILQDGFHQFHNGGIWLDRMADFDFVVVQKEIDKIKKDFDHAVDSRYDLIGHLKQSYDIVDSKSIIERKVLQMANSLDQCTEHWEFVKSAYAQEEKDDYELSLGKCWVNFQRKHEFQPIHNHSGVFSFILFCEIPFEMNEELDNGPGAGASIQLNGMLNFHHISYRGNISTTTIPADKHWIKRMIIFPAELKHSVYPFYSSDDYRITISGNLVSTRR